MNYTNSCTDKQSYGLALFAYNTLRKTVQFGLVEGEAFYRAALLYQKEVKSGHSEQ